MNNNQADVIGQSIEQSLKQYFTDLGGEQPCNVYEMVLSRVEKPLLEVVLSECDGNQTKAAAMLGLNRNTLRKKMLQYDLL